MRRFTFLQTQRGLASLDRRAASAAAWLETEDGRLVIVKSGYKRHWSLPGGFIDAGESPLSAVQREVKEEIGILLPVDSYQFEMVVSRTSLRFGMSYQFLFRATISQDMLDTVVLQNNEIDELQLVTRQEIAHGERNYGTAIYSWAEHEQGYAEHQLD